MLRRLATAVATLALLTPIAEIGPAAQPASAGVAASCAWLGETDQRDVNIGAPDLDAYYWLSVVIATPGTHVVIDGQYPAARYFSLHLYDQTAQPLDSLYDQEINPRHGSSNPYRHKPKPGAGDRYRLRVTFKKPPKHRRPNTMYAGTGHPVVLLEYRVYVPTDPSSPQGGKPWPSVTTETASGTPILTQAGCAVTPPKFGAPVWELAANADYPTVLPRGNDDGASRIPAFTRQFGSMFANQQNAYLAAPISRHFGPMVVLHARVPTFPNTRRGVPVYKHTQVRYWSICTYDSRGEAVYGCAGDYRAAVRHHHVTYVVSDPDVRPTNATKRHGVTWLPWGGLQNSAQILYRNMLPSASFHHAAQQITKPGQSAKKRMGRYYPHAVYCTTKRFERGGWKACFRKAHHH